MRQLSETVGVVPRPIASGARLRRLGTRGTLYLVLLLLSALFGFPMLWAVASSLKTAQEWFVYPPPLLPDIPQWHNYVRVFTIFEYPLGRWFLNTAFVVIASTLGCVLSSSMVAYAFARFRFRGKDVLFLLTLATMMLPAQVTLIPQFILFHRLGWVNTLKPLWAPFWFGGGAFHIFLMKQFLMTLPPELDEAAKMDGAGYWRILWAVLIPLCKPVLATAAIISFMSRWSDFMGPLVYLTTPKRFTISLGLRFFLDTERQSNIKEPMQSILMSATVLAIIPCIVVFFAGQQYFVRGIAFTGLKG